MDKKELKAQRHNEGKPGMSMLPMDALIEIAKVLDFGCAKYERSNWKKGFKYSSIQDSLLRHYAAFESGEDFDKESKLLHTAHLACNALFLLWYQLHPEKGEDNRYKE